LDVFGETELRLKFLQARETWLDSVVNAVPRDDPGTHLTRTMEVMRVHLFDIVTQYRAIFSEEENNLGAETGGQDNRLLFTSWLSRKVGQFLTTVKEDLSGGGVTSTESLLGQAMYFGLSFSRVGFDFRPLLAPLFLSAVEKQFLTALNPSSCLSSLSTQLSSLTLSRLTAPSPLPNADPSTPPLGLLEFPPLGHLTNTILGALNELRQCAPLSLAPIVTASLQSLLQDSAKQILDWHSTLSPTWTQDDLAGFNHLCSAVALLLLPHLQACLSAIFPSSELSLVTGHNRDQLVSLGLGFLDIRSILKPLEAFLPVPEIIGAPVIDVKIDYVADKMEEIAAALDDTNLTEENEKLPDLEVCVETSTVVENSSNIVSSNEATENCEKEVNNEDGEEKS